MDVVLNLIGQLRSGEMLLAVACYPYTLFVIGELIAWLWHPHDPAEDLTPWQITCALLNNIMLLSLFVIQHSGMKTPAFKQWVQPKVGNLERTVYTTCSSFVLHVLMRNWQALGFVIWTLPTWSSLFLYVPWLCACFFLISALLCLDPFELIGIKQIFFMRDYGHSPSHYYSEKLRTFYSHVRHPVFLSVIMLMLAVRVMYIDRFLLLLFFITYMLGGTNVDEEDVKYVHENMKNKANELMRS